MSDPLSIAALTIAVLEQLWNLGQRTAELVADFREFDAVSQSRQPQTFEQLLRLLRTQESKRLSGIIKDENNRTRALKLLLFESTSTYGGATLFDQFDEEVQNQIQNFLEQLISIIDEAHRLLERRHGSTPSASPSPSPTTTFSSTVTLIEPSQGKNKGMPSRISTDLSLKTVKSMQRWRWSLMDKKRVAAIILNFSSVNDRIHANIKLWCLSTSIGVDLQHLRRLKDDENSKKLGYDIDAKLQLVSQASQTSDETMELKDRSLQLFMQQAVSIEDRFAMFDWDASPMLVEHRAVTLDLNDRTRTRVEHLARLLHQEKENLFRILPCKGWVYDPFKSNVAFIFSAPQANGRPFSLLSAIRSAAQKPTPEKQNVIKPSLGQKFHLAHQLSRCISQLQLVRWVHESFRSENILLFPRAGIDELSLSRTEISLDYAQPWVLGFEFSRPEVDFSAGIADICPERDVYRHPERQGEPSKPFSKIHDIYAVGVVLLEIGLWQSAVTLDKEGFQRVKDPQVVQKYLIRQAEKHLGQRMGEKYKAVVLKCLRNDFGVSDDSKHDLKLQQAFRSHVVDVLGRAAEIL